MPIHTYITTYIYRSKYTGEWLIKKKQHVVPVAIFIHPFAMVTVVVGSQSAPKLEAARQGFQRLVETVEITGVAGQVGGVA